ncbi:MAG: LysR substrate-binding domain-containing protein [Oligoflexia bacterium]|nr:LysR substrate-binding domain-containing protein [Oligoflexia bacterium]
MACLFARQSLKSLTVRNSYGHLPSTQALRSFEAAARLKSFSLAAKELLLTHGAISQQIKALESLTGGELFYREGNEMLLTKLGKKLAPQIRRSLDQLLITFPNAQADSDNHRLVLEVATAIAENWLIPRLPSFRKQHPEVILTIKTIPDLSEGHAEDADVSFRYGDGKWKGVHALKLMEEEAFAVCSPDFLAAHPEITLQDIKSYHFLNHAVPWKAWFKKAGLPSKPPQKSSHFNDYTNAIQAAVLGQGIALGRSLLVSDHLKHKRLIRLFDVTVPGAYRYYLLYPKKNPKTAMVAAFKQWIIAELDRSKTQKP